MNTQTAFYSIEYLYQDIVVSFSRVNIERITGTEVLINDLTPYFHFWSYSFNCSILEASENFYCGIYCDKKKLTALCFEIYNTEVEKAKTSKKDGVELKKVFDIFKTFNHYTKSFVLDRVCETLNLQTKNFKGTKYYEEEQVVFGSLGVKTFCKNFSFSLEYLILNEKGIFLKNDLYSSNKGICEYMKSCIKITELFLSKKEVVDLLKKFKNKTFSFDNKEFKKDTIFNLVGNIKKESEYYFLVDFIKKYSK